MKIGLILSGGIAKGAYQVGVLRAVEEFFSLDEISYISAASVGALNAAAYAAGETKTADRVWSEICSERKRLFLPSVLKSDILQKRLFELSDYKIGCEKLYVPLLDLRKRTVVYKDLASENAAVRYLCLKAAISIPPLCSTVKIGTNRYCDGALADNIPFFPLLGCDVDYAICVYFDDNDYIFGSDCFTRRVIKISFPEDNRFLYSSFCFDEKSYSEMREQGYRKAKAVFDIVLSGGVKDPESVRRNILNFNRVNEKKKVFLTTDKVLNNANMMVRHFLKRNIL